MESHIDDLQGEDEDHTTRNLEDDEMNIEAPPSVLLLVLPASDTSSSNVWKGFKWVANNIDKKVCASYQRTGMGCNHRITSYHAYTVLDKSRPLWSCETPNECFIVDPLKSSSKNDMRMIETNSSAGNAILQR